MTFREAAKHVYPPAEHVSVKIEGDYRSAVFSENGEDFSLLEIPPDFKLEMALDPKSGNPQTKNNFLGEV